MIVDAQGKDYREVDEIIRNSSENIEVINPSGQRFMGAALQNRRLNIYGIAGNALGCYLDGGTIEVFGDAQDAVGDTMNEGTIVVHGSAGDALGYAMRGGRIFVEKNAGYRAGIHMKAYGEKCPVIVIGGRTGSFLGEYQAGGLIIVLGLGRGEDPISGYFTAAGMYGGRIVLRNPGEVLLRKECAMRIMEEKELEEISGHIRQWCSLFNMDEDAVFDAPFYVVESIKDAAPRQRYVAN
ncbi:MAG: glutamate synthase [Candidatus Ornithospirochaeta sp.]